MGQHNGGKEKFLLNIVQQTLRVMYVVFVWFLVTKFVCSFVLFYFCFEYVGIFICLYAWQVIF